MKAVDVFIWASVGLVALIIVGVVLQAIPGCQWPVLEGQPGC